MELEALVVLARISPFAFPLHHLLVLVVVPALRLIKGHEEQRELPHVGDVFLQSPLSTHQQRPNQSRVNIPFLKTRGYTRVHNCFNASEYI